MSGADTTVWTLVAAVLAIGLSISGRLIYRIARDVARVGQRLAYLEGTQQHPHEPTEPEDDR